MSLPYETVVDFLEALAPSSGTAVQEDDSRYCPGPSSPTSTEEENSDANSTSDSPTLEVIPFEYETFATMELQPFVPLLTYAEFPTPMYAEQAGEDNSFQFRGKGYPNLELDICDEEGRHVTHEAAINADRRVMTRFNVRVLGLDKLVRELGPSFPEGSKIEEWFICKMKLFSESGQKIRRVPQSALHINTMSERKERNGRDENRFWERDTHTALFQIKWGWPKFDKPKPIVARFQMFFTEGWESKIPVSREYPIYMLHEPGKERNGSSNNNHEGDSSTGKKNPKRSRNTRGAGSESGSESEFNGLKHREDFSDDDDSDIASDLATAFGATTVVDPEE